MLIRKCLLAKLILMLVILMLTLMRPYLNTGYAYTAADLIMFQKYVLVLYIYVFFIQYCKQLLKQASIFVGFLFCFYC